MSTIVNFAPKMMKMRYNWPESQYARAVRCSIELTMKHGALGQVATIRGILGTSLYVRLLVARHPELQRARFRTSVIRKAMTGRWAEKTQRLSHCRYPVSRYLNPSHDILHYRESRRKALSTLTWQQKVNRNAALSVFKTMLKVKVAHGMDPVQRAGQTKESNVREALRYGRTPVRKKRSAMPFFKLVMSLLFALICPPMLHGDLMVKCILKGLEKQQTQKDRSRSDNYVCCIRR
ncbi:MAG: hypothetical protein ACTJLL_02775 [Anaplasma sp.]